MYGGKQDKTATFDFGTIWVRFAFIKQLAFYISDVLQL